MLEIPICPEPGTGKERTLCYDEHGYSVLVGGRVVMTRRLEAVCYLVGREGREQIARTHGLQDVGEHRMAEWLLHNAYHQPLE